MERRGSSFGRVGADMRVIHQGSPGSGDTDRSGRLPHVEPVVRRSGESPVHKLVQILLPGGWQLLEISKIRLWHACLECLKSQKRARGNINEEDTDYFRATD